MIFSLADGGNDLLNHMTGIIVVAMGRDVLFQLPGNEYLLIQRTQTNAGLDDSAAISMAGQLLSVLGHPSDDFGEELDQPITVAVSKNQLDDIVAILILAQTEKFVVIECENSFVKLEFFLMIFAQSQSILNKASNDLVDAAIIDSVFDDIQGELGGNRAHLLSGGWGHVSLCFLKKSIFAVGRGRKVYL